ncbi:MAG: NADH-quinone oxidoreductase subunit NuoK [Euryarchaeota archaeon]|nr:NADH-quinone oxidoreductase subunit NuoK [Euryarchaeota archaeon]
MIPLSHYLVVSTILFGIGAYGLLRTRNAVKILMCIEIMLNAANINLVAFSRYTGEMSGQVFVTFSISIAAAEAAIGLAIILVIYRIYSTIDAGKIDSMKW